MTKRVGIVGSGIMGSGIAEVAAKAGIEVVLRSRSQTTADAMVAGLEKSLAKQVERGKLDDAERTAVLGRVTAVSDLGELADCDLVIESIVEDLADEEAPLQRARPHRRRRRRSSPPTRRRCPWSRWRWRPAAPSWCAASTSSTRRR